MKIEDVLLQSLALRIIHLSGIKRVLIAAVFASLVSITTLTSEISRAFLPVWWQPTKALPQALANHTALVHESQIYVIGGGNAINNAVNMVYYARVNRDGTLDNWMDTASLPLGIMAHGTAASDLRVYITGGWTGDSYLDTTYCADFLPDGGLNPWEMAPARLPVKLDLHASVRYNDWLYVIGGWNGKPLRTVYLARLQSDGCVDRWREITELPQSLYRHTAVVFEGRIYVIGGRTEIGGDKFPVDTVYVGTILSDGDVDKWDSTSRLQRPSYYHAAFVSETERRVYLTGGSSGKESYDAVFSAYVNDDGTLQSWQEELSLKLPAMLFRHAAVLGNNGVPYILGGRIDQEYQNSVYYISPLTLTKSSDPSGPVHEGDVITYTISYANTGLIPQTNVVITDRIPSNTDWVHGSISPDHGVEQNGVISWTFESLAVGETGAVSFQVRIPLLRHLEVESVSPPCPPTPPPHPARVLPAAISCDTTRFWAHGVTRQPSVTPPYTVEVQIPPNTSPSEMWLLMKGTDNTAPRIEGQPAHLLTSTHNAFGASVWTTTVTSAMIEEGEVTVVTDNPRELNALFLFDAKDPPFDERDLRVFADMPATFTYTLEIPSVKASAMDVLLPFMDITYWTDSSPPEFDGRMITVSVELEGEPTQTPQTILANQPNMGNGLLMTQFPINLRAFTDTITKTKVLTITVDSEDDAVYTLGPRVCRPVYVENTAWLCSDQAGCISATTRNIPENFAPLSIYLPIILKSSP